jgi:threonine/homoserine/homoserine lactone efflux protein
MSVLPSTPILIAYAGACTVLAATPGPDMALFLQKTLNGGRAHGLTALAGVMTGVLAHTLAAALGLTALIAASARLYDALRIAGALYLLWLAYEALRHSSALKLDARERARSSLAKTYFTGVLINLTNPKIILFFMTFLPQFIEAGDPEASRKFFALGLGFVLIATLVNGAAILVASRFVAAARAHPRAVRVFDYFLASVMGAFAARLLIARGR